ncbi:MAG: tetratricopeptide repeat protein [Terriglobia bacterium]
MITGATRYWWPAALALILTAGACSHGPQFYVDRGKGFAAGGKYEEAAINYRKALASDVDNGEACYQLSLALLHLGQTQDAYQQLSRAAELLPNRDDIAITFADLTFAGYLADKRRPQVLHDRLASLSAQLLVRNQRSYDGLRLKANLAATDKKYKEAEDLYRAANEVKALQSPVILGWTEVLLADGQPKDAEELAYRLIAKEKTFGPIYDLLFSYYARSGRRPDAEKIARLRVANNPSDAGSYLRLAAFYADAGNEGEMQSALQHLTGNSAAFPQAHLQVGEFYAKLRRWDPALAQFDEGSRTHPGDRAEYLKRIANVWLAQGKPGPARKAIDEILTIKPADEAAQMVKAELLVSGGQPDGVAKGVTLLETLTAKNPGDANLHFNLGRALLTKGDREGARLQFIDATRRRAGFLPPRIALAEMEQARGDYKAAFQYADEILAIDPGLPQIRLLRAVCLMHLDRNADARTELRNLAQAAPGNREVLLQTAALDLNEKKLGEAEKGFRRLAAENPGDAQAISGVVATLMASKQSDQAISFLQAEVQKKPDALPVRLVLAETAVRMGRYDLAIEQYQRILAAAPASGQMMLAMGNVYLLKKDYPAAIAWVQKARAAAPQDPNAMAQLATLLAGSGRNRESLDLFRQALKLRPDDAALLSNTAYLIVETSGSADEALPLAQKAVRLDANEPHYADTLGWVYLRKGQNDSALQMFGGLTEKYPENETFHYHFGMALLQHGDRAGANREFRAALAGKPAEDVRRGAEAALSGHGAGGF